MADLKSCETSRSDFEPYGFTVERWQPAKVPRLDRHGEIEINYVPKGTITYICGGKRVVVYSRQLIVFWASIPHQVVGFDQADPYYVITVPSKQQSDR
jgi:hypothetical protein